MKTAYELLDEAAYLLQVAMSANTDAGVSLKLAEARATESRKRLANILRLKMELDSQLYISREKFVG